MRRLALPTAFLGMASALSACDASDRGFVQIETVPEYASTFYIGEQKLPPLARGGSIFQHAVGTQDLQVRGKNGLVRICKVDVRKDRITKVTVVYEHTPSCRCRSSGGANSERVCTS